MNELRYIKVEEKTLITYLLEKANLAANQYKINELVDDYEGAKMGSIGLGKPEAQYDSDIIQVEYKDIDGVDVVITLTKDSENQILDLDFWKVDFSKLIRYPQTKDLIFKEPYLPIGE
jgi:uncharacterized lipoprotein YehR (DUF1307 family)